MNWLARRQKLRALLMVNRRQVCEFILTAVLLSGCAGSIPSRSNATATPRTMAARTVEAMSRPAPRTLTLAWECHSNALDGSVLTGIEASADLVSWQVATNWPLVTVSNTWTLTCDQPAQFYRAFTKWTVPPVVAWR